MITNLKTKLDDSLLHGVVAISAAAFAMQARLALAQDTGGGDGDFADVGAPIDQISQARDQAADSNLTAEDAVTTAENIGNLLIVWAAPIGLAIALFGFYLLYQANNDDSGRTSKGPAFFTIIIGGCTAVFSVLTFMVINYFLGSPEGT